MLAYLDALLEALSRRDAAVIRRLLEHPLARILPADAREEAEVFALGSCDAVAAPLRVMRLRHQTCELLRDAPAMADVPEQPVTGAAPRSTTATMPRRASRLVQMELPLSA